MNTMQVSAYQRRAHNACPDPEITLWVSGRLWGACEQRVLPKPDTKP
jgi:hypothetical protein